MRSNNRFLKNRKSNKSKINSTTFYLIFKQIFNPFFDRFFPILQNDSLGDEKKKEVYLSIHYLIYM